MRKKKNLFISEKGSIVRIDFSIRIFIQKNFSPKTKQKREKIQYLEQLLTLFGHCCAE